jgi:hypothetical protein
MKQHKDNTCNIINIMTKKPTRHCVKWNINELLNLQREYELLEMSVNEIAKRHDRSINSIVNTLVGEKIIDRWEDARGYADAELIRQALMDGDLVLDESCDDSDCSDSDSEYEDEEEEETLPRTSPRLRTKNNRPKNF